MKKSTYRTLIFLSIFLFLISLQISFASDVSHLSQEDSAIDDYSNYECISIDDSPIYEERNSNANPNAIDDRKIESNDKDSEIKTNDYENNSETSKTIKSNDFENENEKNSENPNIIKSNENEDNVNLSAPENQILADSGTVYFDANAVADGNGTQSNPYKTLNGRLSGYSNYVFAPGRYTISTAPASGFSFSQQDMTIMGSDPLSTIIEYTGSGTFINSSSNLTFIGVTLKNIHIVSSGLLNATNTIFDGGVAPVEAEGNYYYGNSYGGAIRKSSSSGSLFDGISGISTIKDLILDSCIFRNNHAAYGGAIYLENGSAKIRNTVFENNYAENGGGAISAVNNGSIAIDSCTFKSDRSIYDAGGAVYLFNNTRATIRNSNFNGNSGGLGGAIASLRSDLNIISSNFTSNNVSYAGGAVFGMYGSISIENSNFTSNKAKYGGAAYADNLTKLSIYRDSFTKNTAGKLGGAILAFANNQSEIFDVEYTGNMAEKYNDLYESDILGIFIGSENYTMLKYNSRYNGSLPSKFDLRTENGVTGLNDQANSGNCWAYASIAVVESCALKASGNVYNFSEGNLKNLAQIFSDFGWGYETNQGGFYQMPIGYLTSWAGPVDSRLDPADDWDVIAPLLDSSVHIQNILYLKRTSYTDNSRIKEALMNYGAVATEIYISNSYLQSNGNYYCDKDMERNHAICVIGWDDGRSISGAPGPGAWIVKNSYGSKWGDKGYGYVSYYDHTLFRLNDESHNSFTIIFNDTVRFNRNYQYDYCGFTDYFVTGNDTIYYANEFTAEDDDNLAAFSTFFNRTTDWQAKIYVNGALKDTMAGTSEGGYYTFNLDSQIPLNKGDKFRVEIRIHSEGQANFPISEASQYGATRKHFKPGVSFFSYDGSNWNDLYDYEFTFGENGTAGSHIYYGQVACIKAFTSPREKDNKDTEIEVINANKSSIEAVLKNIQNENTIVIENGNLTFKIGDEKLTVPIVNGKAVLNRNFNPGSYSIRISFIGNESLNPSETSFTHVIEKEKLSPNIEVQADSIHEGENCTISVSFSCEDAVIKLKINNRTDVSSIKNGLCKFIIPDLVEGIYEYTISFDGNDNFNGRTVKGNVAVLEKVEENNATCIDLDDLEKLQNGTEKIIIKLHDSNGNPIANSKLLIDINSTSDERKNSHYEYYTNLKGEIHFNPSCDVGTYDVFVYFQGSEGHDEALSKSKLTIKSNETNGTNEELTNKINGTDMTLDYGKTGPFCISAYDSEGNPLVNVRIRFKLADGWYSRKTDSNGLARLNIYLSPGTYEIVSVHPITGEKVTNTIKVKGLAGKSNDNDDLNGIDHKSKSYPKVLKSPFSQAKDDKKSISAENGNTEKEHKTLKANYKSHEIKYEKNIAYSREIKNINVENRFNEEISGNLIPELNLSLIFDNLAAKNKEIFYSIDLLNKIFEIFFNLGLII